MRSLRIKMMVWSLVIICMSFLLLVLIGLYSMNKMYLDQKVKELRPVLENLATKIDINQLDNFDENQNGTIIKLYNTSSEMLILSQTFNEGNPDQDTLDAIGLVELPSNSEINDALSTYVGIVLEGNDVNVIGKIPHFTGRSIIVGTPIWHDGVVEGAMFMMAPSVTYDVFLKGFVGHFIRLMLVFTLIILVFLYFMLSKFVREFSQLSHIAFDMCEGNYETQIAEETYAELNGLIKSLNTLSRKLSSEKEKSATLERYRQEYFSNVSHELKSPLAAIRSRTEVLCDEMIDDPVKIKSYHSVILSEALRMQALIEDMMVLSKLKSDVTHFEKSLVNICELLISIGEKYKILAEACHIDLVLKIISDKDECRIMTNGRIVEQIISSLLDNALKFTKENGTIIIECYKESSGLLIKVKDDGIGISEEEMPMIFERYYKVDKSRAGEGAGLGLSITKELVEKLGAEIGVTSSEGEGTIFSLNLKENRN